MPGKHRSRDELRGKIIDGHSHIGVGIMQYYRGEFPYAQTVEGIYYQQLFGGIDINIVFPLSVDLYCEPELLHKGIISPGKFRVSPTPYEAENRSLMKEVYHYCPELSSRFLPFVCVDPGREVPKQLAELKKLQKTFPFYGIKVNPVGCQSCALELLNSGDMIMEFAKEHNMPLIFHATTAPNDVYSQASDIFKLIEMHSGLRFCLAHCLLFHRGLLSRAAENPNVWVDTAAIKIQVDLARSLAEKGIISYSDLIDVDFTDYREVMNNLCIRYPNTIIWGSDSPAYAYFCRRKQGKNVNEEFSFKGTYEDEIEALNSVPADIRKMISNRNTLNFVFGNR